MWPSLRSVLPTLAFLACCVATPAGAQGIECLDPGNRLTNCGFDTSVSGWEAQWGTVAHQPGDGFPQPGSLEAAAPWDPITIASSVVQVLQPLGLLAPVYDVGIDARLISGGGLVTCSIGVRTVDGHPAYLTFTPTSQWQRVVAQLGAPSASHLSYFFVSCQSYASFTMRFDDAYLGLPANSADVGVELSSCTGSVELGGGVAYSAVVRNLDAFWSVDVDVLSSLPGSCR